MVRLSPHRTGAAAAYAARVTIATSGSIKAKESPSDTDRRKRLLVLRTVTTYGISAMRPRWVTETNQTPQPVSRIPAWAVRFWPNGLSEP